MTRITTKAPYGQHIDLQCVNHPDLRWSTKNIDFIGARTIFYALGVSNAPRECSCPRKDLEPVPIDGPDVPE